MKKRIVFWGLILSLALTFSLCAEDTAKIANRQTAVRCLQLAKSYISQNIWDAVASKIEMGLVYDDSISDLWYLNAVAKTHNGAPRYEILPLVERALNEGEWVDYNRDNARILYADLLCDIGLNEKALEVLDEEPFLFSADAEYIRVKAYYLEHSPEGFEKARGKVDAARRVYPMDARFARLFLRNEYSLLSEGQEMDPAVRRLADAFSLLIPKYSDGDPELELYAALFSDGEKRVRLLSTYHAKGLSHPLYAAASLQAGLMTQKEAVEYFIDWADVSVSLEYLTRFISMITEEEPKQFLKEYLNSYDGVITADTDGDLEPNLFVDYMRGRPKNMQWDKNNDGIEDWTAECDFGVPLSVCIPEKKLTAEYGSYPFVTKLVYVNGDDKKVSVFLADEQCEWTPFEIIPHPLFQTLLETDFYVPFVKNEAVSFDSFQKFWEAASAYEIDSDEYSGASIRFTLINGIPQSADYFLTGTQYAQAFFENGIPVFRAVDRDNDGIFETTETFAVDSEDKIEISEEDSRLLMTSIFGYPVERNGLYLKMIQIDQNADTKPDFTEEYLAGNGKITSWDSDNDGQWDTRYVRYPQKPDENILEDSMFYLMPGRILTTLSCVDGEPVKIISDQIEYTVIRGESSDFYWVGSRGTPNDEKAVLEALESVNEQGVSILVQNESVRILSVKMAARCFGRIIPDEEVTDSFNNPENSSAE